MALNPEEQYLERCIDAIRSEPSDLKAIGIIRSAVIRYRQDHFFLKSIMQLGVDLGSYLKQFGFTRFTYSSHLKDDPRDTYYLKSIGGICIQVDGWGQVGFQIGQEEGEFHTVVIDSTHDFEEFLKSISKAIRIPIHPNEQ